MLKRIKSILVEQAKDLAVMSAQDAFYDYEAEEVSNDYKVYKTEEDMEHGKIKVQEIVKHYWQGTPFIVFSKVL
ncbi:hypothetical protein [Priestia megaterium]|uniref:hypothetical protein n=1 Tax=Priestia megaterium TaxID=1404 RepID=UPI002E1E12BE|nr:hypothetical protein [Priestia megaterium]